MTAPKSVCAATTGLQLIEPLHSSTAAMSARQKDSRTHELATRSSVQAIYKPRYHCQSPWAERPVHPLIFF